MEVIPDEVTAHIFSFVIKDDDSTCPYINQKMTILRNVSSRWYRIVLFYFSKDCIYNSRFRLCKFHDITYITLLREKTIMNNLIRMINDGYTITDGYMSFHVPNHNGDQIKHVLEKIMYIVSRNDIKITIGGECCNRGNTISIKGKYKKKLKNLLEHVYQEY